MKNVKCHICDHQNEIPDGQSPFCVRCGTDLTEPKVETKLMEDTKSARFATVDKMSSPGVEAFIYLTDKRLIAIPAKLQGFGLTGMVTAAVYNKMTSDQGLISIPFENMKTVRDGKFGLLVKALIVDTTDGELLKMGLSNRNEWKEAITKAISSLR